MATFLATQAVPIAHDPKPSAEDLTIPLGWVTGGTLATFGLFFSIVWWVGKLAAKVDATAKSVQSFEEKLEKERVEDINHRKELKNDLRIAFKTDIAQSATDVCHGFELFAIEMRQELKRLSERLGERDATVNRLGRKVDHIGNEMLGMVQQLQASGVPVHYRRVDNGPPSQPHNYDEDYDG